MADIKINATSVKYNDKDTYLVGEEDLKRASSKAGSVVTFEASNITALSNDILDQLKVGDVVQKITGNSKHCYVVTYKGTGAGSGICLTYVDCGYMETVSYDRSGSGWVYNSTDRLEVGEGGLELIEWDGERIFTQAEVQKLLTCKVGVKKVLGSVEKEIFVPNYIDTSEENESINLSNAFYDGDVTSPLVSQLNIQHDGSFQIDRITFDELKGTKLYRHEISFTSEDSDTGLIIPCFIISTRSTPYTLDYFNVFVGLDAITLSFDDNPSGVVVSGIAADFDTSTEKYNIVLNNGTLWEDVSDFVDTVTPL